MFNLDIRATVATGETASGAAAHHRVSADTDRGTRRDVRCTPPPTRPVNRERRGGGKHIARVPIWCHGSKKEDDDAQDDEHREEHSNDTEFARVFRVQQLL